jgi:hypothetical protein
MKINKKSWHYRYYAWTYDKIEETTPPYRTNLCRYFWRFPLASLVMLFLFVLFPVAIVGSVSFATFFIGRSMYHHLGWWNVLVVAGIAAIVYLTRLRGKISNNETVQLVGAYVAAKKQGVCPLIEFEDDDEHQ